MTGKKRDRKLKLVPPGKRQLKTVTNGHTTPIEKAIDRVQAKATEPEPPKTNTEPEVISLKVQPEPMRMTGNDALRITSPPKENTTVVLVLDGKANSWRAVLLPPGSTWKLVPDRPSAPKATLFLPPGYQR